MDGLFLLDKEVGLTSRAVDNRIQKKFSQKKVGHLGTLDPFASGLLILALGKGTKYLPYLPDGKKTYEAKLRLGYQSDTGDPTGTITGDGSYTKLDIDAIEKALKSLLGKSLQIPPMQSAIKINGKALYELAHRGKEVERRPREIEVSKAELLSYEDGIVSFRVEVSKGTYVRTLGEDLAKRLGTTGYLTELRRTAVGDISLLKAKKLDELGPADLVDPSELVELPKREVEEASVAKIKNGVKISLEETAEKLLLTYQGDGLAVYYKVAEGVYASERGLF